MTATEPVKPVCPACHSTNTNVGASGLALCFDCAEQWDPATVTALPKPAIAPFAMAPVEEVYPIVGDGLDDVTDAELDAASGHHPSNVETPADPDAHSFPPTWHGLQAYRKAGGEISDELWYDNFVAPAAEPLHPADALGNEEAAAVQMTAELATLIVKAAVASMPGVLSAEETDIAPIGFLPDDPGLFPIVEQAAVQAVRGVIAVFDLDAAALLEAIGATGS